MNRLALTKVTLSNKNYIAYALLDEQRKFVDFQLFEHITNSQTLPMSETLSNGVKKNSNIDGQVTNADGKYLFYNENILDSNTLPSEQTNLNDIKKQELLSKTTHFTKNCTQSHEILNNIYIGRVENIVSNINAAFVKISPTQKCYLSLEDLKSPIFTKRLSEKKPISIGDELIVQVIKDSIKTKEPVVSTKLTLSGTYCVLTTDNLTLTISKKITGEKRSELQALINEIKEQAENHQFGIVIRTNATEVPKEIVFADMQQVIEQFIKLKSQSVHKSAFSVLVKEKEAYIRKLKSLDLSTLDGIYTDDTNIYETIQAELPYLENNTFLHFYQDKMISLKALYNISGSIEELLKKRVWLKSGANIIIEQLETMTIIDINSGKNISKNENTLCVINKEAAVEIARQLRLRNISGMIIIDFINMKSKKQMQEVTDVLKEALKNDPIPADFIDVTKLGLVEVTRKKTYKSLKEIVSST